MSKLIVVTGATGEQGRSVVNYFLENEPSYKIRGLTRRPDSDAAKALSAKGIEVVQADLDDLASLQKVFAGANAIYAYTAFGDIAGSDEVKAKLQSGVFPIGKAAAEIEYRHGKNIADAAAGVSELERLVWSALADVTKLSNGKYTNCSHFDIKAHVTDYMMNLEGLKGKVSTVLMGSFANNPIKMPDLFAPKKQPDGTFVMYFPQNGDAVTPWIEVDRDGGALVAALLKAPAGTQLNGVSEFLSNKQWLNIWASHLGVQAQYQQIPFDKFVENDPVGIQRQLAETMAFVEEFGITGGDPSVVTPDELEKQTGIKIPRHSIVDHVKRQDWSAIL